MAEHDIPLSAGTGEPEPGAASASIERRVARLDLIKVVAIPLVTLVLGFVFNASLDSRQTREGKLRLYTEMMGRREESDSALRKDMFNSILGTFMSKDPNPKVEEQLEQQVLNLELLAYNFHQSLDLGPLFKHVRHRIPDDERPAHVAMRRRLENVAQEVLGQQLTGLSDSGMVEAGDVSLDGLDDLRAYIRFGSHSVPDSHLQPGEGVSRVCLTMDSRDGVRHHRQFVLEIVGADPRARELQVRLYVSRVLALVDCQRADLDLVANREIDTTFWVGLFDLPMIDNTHLTHSERCAVSLKQITPDSANLALTYFPSSRASLKDKPYYDDLVHDLIQGQHVVGHGQR
jgi:hypothetical protein